MPMHDWTRVPAGTYHFFHQRWVQDLAAALNSGHLPPGYFVMSESAESARGDHPWDDSEAARYARRADRLVVHRSPSERVAVIEIVSPGNKSSLGRFRSFVGRVREFLRQGIHLLVVDPFPPSPGEPNGLHAAIRYPGKPKEFDVPAGKPLTVAAYCAGEEGAAYVANCGVGDPLPDMPMFLRADCILPAPLERTYMNAWAAFPTGLKGPLEAA